MERNFTSAELADLIAQLEKVFDVAEVTEGDEKAANGFTLGYAAGMNGTDCVLACPVTVDGVRRTLRLAGAAAGTAQAEDAVSARERELYRDDLIRDFLTGAYNRRFWESVFCKKIGARVAAGQPVAVALVKIDNYADVVRAHGQPVADQLVCCVANQWKKYYDEGSEKVVCRLAGATYAVGCVGAEELDLETQMRVLYEKMNRECLATVGMMCRVPFTLSVACAGTDEVDSKVWPELYAICDQRLRAMTAAGGNGVYNPHKKN